MRELLPKLAALPNTPLPAVAWYVASALKIVRSDDWAEPSLAARREAKRLGIAIAAIMPMIATTMRSSISEKPSWRLVFISFHAPWEVWIASSAIGFRLRGWAK